MQNQPLGQSKLSVSRLSLGTMTFASQVDEPAARSMIDLCLERGVNFLDTANVYNAGDSESMLSRLLAGRRDHFVLATKVGLKVGEAADDQGLSPAAIRKAIDASLKRLQTDYVDLYYLHAPDYSVPIEETLATLDELVKAGKIRYPAVSNYASWQITKMLWLGEKNGWQPIVAVQPMYNLLARRIEPELLPCCTDQKVAVVPYNPLAGGLLTGKHQQNAPIPGTRFERMPMYRDRYWNAENFAAVERLSEIARSAGRSITRLALGWLLAQKAVTSVILGVSRLEHLADSLAAIDDPALPAEVLAACDEVWGTLRGVAPSYNR
jgi:aryl-alcohol dehydrogenase-like predicted oxidoreductase